MQVFIERENRREELDFSGTAEQLLSRFAINPQTVLVIRNGALVTEDEELEAGDEITLLTVVSGG